MTHKRNNTIRGRFSFNWKLDSAFSLQKIGGWLRMKTGIFMLGGPVSRIQQALFQSQHQL